MTIVRWVCDNPQCKRLAVELRVPANVQPAGYAPTRCQWCGSTKLVKKEAA